MWNLATLSHYSEQIHCWFHQASGQTDWRDRVVQRMITRRRRQGSETEQQTAAETQSLLLQQPQVLKGPSQSALFFSSESSHQQPSFFIVPPAYAESGAYSAPSNADQLNINSVQPKNEAMALSSSGASTTTLLSSANNSSRDRTAEFLSAVRSFQSRPTNGVIPNQMQPSRNADPQRQQYSDFMKAAKYVAKDQLVKYFK